MHSIYTTKEEYQKVILNYPIHSTYMYIPLVEYAVYLQPLWPDAGLQQHELRLLEPLVSEGSRAATLPAVLHVRCQLKDGRGLHVAPTHVGTQRKVLVDIQLQGGGGLCIVQYMCLGGGGSHAVCVCVETHPDLRHPRVVPV